MNINPDEIAPYGIINFDVLWWVVVGVTLTIIITFYLISLHFTKPLKGDPDTIFYKKKNYLKRNGYQTLINEISKSYSSGQINIEGVAKEISDAMIGFLQTKTNVDITGYSYEDLAESGAPDELLRVISQSYYILYSPISEGEKAQRITEMIELSRKVVSQWR